MKDCKVNPILVEEIPPSKELQEGNIYISHKYGTAIHLCACGCGEEVVTPLSNEGWTLFFNGKFSLNPSIGNFQFPCRSHYFIINEEIRWCEKRQKEDTNSSLFKNGKKKNKNKKKFWKKFF